MNAVRFTLMCLCIAGFSVGWSMSRADEPYLSPLKPPQRQAPPGKPQPLTGPTSQPAAIQAWGVANSNCAEWTNSCTVCRRAEASAIACSTPGIACQPKDIACSKPVEKKQ